MSREQFENYCKTFKTFSIMKKLVVSLIAFVMFGFAATAQTKFVKMELPRSIQSPAGLSETIVKNVSFKDKSGQQSRGQLRFVIPDKGNGLISLEFTENILLAGGIKIDFFMQNQNALTGEPADADEISLSECLTKCTKDFTNPDGSKIPGRGQCKAGCWWEEVKEILPLAVTLLI